MAEIVQFHDFGKQGQLLSSPFSQLPPMSIFGLGYVGAVSAACFADRGAVVCGVDLDTTKTALIQMGQSPIVEPGLDELIAEGVSGNRLYVSASCAYAIMHSQVSFICVGTPSTADGGCDTQYLERVCEQIGHALADKEAFHVVVFRSTVPPGTTEDLLIPKIEDASGKKAGMDFGVAFNPEFLRESTAIKDFAQPPKTVIGTACHKTAEIVASLYRGIDDEPIITSVRAAEMVKYADNSWHATKVCFANEIGRLCKAMSIDSHDVMDIFVQDHILNISPYYMKPGFAFGGSCLPKDVRGIHALAVQHGVETPLLSNLIDSNDAHIRHAIGRIEAQEPERIALLGITFKADTDDLRESPMLTLLAELLRLGHDIKVYDPNIKGTDALKHYLQHAKMAPQQSQRLLEALPKLLMSSAEEAIDGRDLVVVSHASDAFKEVMLQTVPHKTIIDLARCARNLTSTEGYDGICW